MLVLIKQITGPPAKSHPAHSRTETPTSTPLPSPTPLPEFTIPTYAPYPPTGTDGSVKKEDGRPLYVAGNAAERQAKLSRMSSPLRRGTYESWWTGDMAWFNAVSKVSCLH